MEEKAGVTAGTFSAKNGVSTWLRPILIIGSALYMWLLTRSWVGPDELAMLGLGERLASTHQLSPMAKTMFGGGLIPGSLLQILVGLPLMIWPDYRAPIVLMGVIVLACGLVLYRTLRGRVEQDFLVVYLGIYWLAPWRLFNAGFLWEPSYILLPAALHLWATTRLNEQAKAMWPSFTLGLLLTASTQLHGSSLFLWILTFVLVLRRKIAVQWIAAMVGAMLGALTLIPMLLAGLDHTLPQAAPNSTYFGHGLVMVYPLIKPLLFWLRMPTLELTGPIREGGYYHHPSTLIGSINWLVLAVTCATLALSVLTYRWYFLRRNGTHNWTWFERYAAYAFLAITLAAAAAPMPLQGWHVMVSFHAAVIPVAYWLTAWLRQHSRRKPYFAGYLVIAVLVTVWIGFTMPLFQKRALPWQLRSYPEVEKLLPHDLPYAPIPMD